MLLVTFSTGRRQKTIRRTQKARLEKNKKRGKPGQTWDETIAVILERKRKIRSNAKGRDLPRIK